MASPCKQGVGDASCIVYSGSSLLCSGIMTNDRLDVILAKINSKICNIPSINITLQGDVSGVGNETIVTTLATVNNNIGTFGSSTLIPQITVDGKGRILSVTNVAISGTVGGPAGGDLSGTYPNPTTAKLNGQLPAYYLSRTNHTGTQLSTTISDFTSASQAVGDARYPQLSSSYSNPSWISALAYSKLTGVPSSFPPSGSASGDLSGSYPGPTVTWINGYSIYDLRYVTLGTSQTITGAKTFSATTNLSSTILNSGIVDTAGLKFTQLTSASTTVGTLAVALSVDSLGNVILGDVPTGGGGGGAVDSVFGRTGTVTAQANDYSASLISNTPSGSISSTTVQAAINELDSEKQPLDTDLTVIAGLSPTNDDVLQRKSGAWTNRTIGQLKTDLVLTRSDVGLSNVDNTSDATKNSASVTLTNKTISGTANTITNIGTSSIVNDAITYAKIQNVSSQKVLGRYDLASGDIQEITLDSSLALNSTTGVLSVVGGGGTCIDTQALWINNLSAAISASLTQYTNPVGGAPNSTETTRVIVAPASGHLKNLFLFATGTQPSSGSLVITIRTGASVAALADTALALTVAANTAAGTGSVYSSTSTTISVNAGDLISIKLRNNATATSLTLGSISLQYTN